MKQRNIPCPKCPAMFWTQRSLDNHLDEVSHEDGSAGNEWTKVNVRKDLVEQIKIKAAADNRTITNYLETLILKDLSLAERVTKKEGK